MYAISVLFHNVWLDQDNKFGRGKVLQILALHRVRSKALNNHQIP